MSINTRTIPVMVKIWKSKKERLLTYFSLSAIIVILITYYVYIPSLVNIREAVAKKNPFLYPTLVLIEKKDLIVNFQPLRDLLRSTYEVRDDYMIAIYFEYFPTGANIAINKDEKIWPASLIKIPVAMAAMKKVENKKWKLSNELVILDDDKDKEYGTLYEEPSGTTLTIQRFLEESLINSDNTAHFVLLRNIDAGELEDVYVHLGMDDIINALKKAPNQKEVEDNRMTAKIYSIFFRSLYNATFLNQEYSQLFLSMLAQAPRDLLAQDIPREVPFVHKTGIRTDEAVRADSGVVYVPGRPYLLTVMIQKKGKGDLNKQEVDELFKNIGKQVYDYVAHAH